MFSPILIRLEFDEVRFGFYALALTSNESCCYLDSKASIFGNDLCVIRGKEFWPCLSAKVSPGSLPVIFAETYVPSADVRGRHADPIIRSHGYPGCGVDADLLGVKGCGIAMETEHLHTVKANIVLSLSLTLPWQCMAKVISGNCASV